MRRPRCTSASWRPCRTWRNTRSASRATVGLSCRGGSLGFSVTDDGAGFDTAQASSGTGLQGMADRLAAMGGTLRIWAEPGLGTTVSGRLPVAGLAETRR